MGTTLPETNIAPETGWLEYQFPFFGMVYFQIVQAFLLFVFRGCDWDEFSKYTLENERLEPTNHIKSPIWKGNPDAQRMIYLPTFTP